MMETVTIKSATGGTVTGLHLSLVFERTSKPNVALELVAVLSEDGSTARVFHYQSGVHIPAFNALLCIYSSVDQFIIEREISGQVQRLVAATSWEIVERLDTENPVINSPISNADAAALAGVEL